jgi:hypothetical protein
MMEEESKAKAWKGPRNLPQATAKKKKRRAAKQARKRNRGVYSGQ